MRVSNAPSGWVVNARSTGAVGNGVTDDTAAIMAAATQAGSGGIVVLPPGTYIVSPTLQPNGAYGCLNFNVPVYLWGPGATLKLRSGSAPIVASTFLVYPNSSAAWIILDGVILDGNAAGQALAGMGAQINLCGFATRNPDQSTRLGLRGVVAQNFNTKAGGSTFSSGIGIDDYGCSLVVIDGTLRGEGCDTAYWHTTQVPNSGACRLVADKIVGHNSILQTLYVETCGQISVEEVLSYSDAQSNAVAVVVKTPTGVGNAEDVHIGRIVAENQRALALGQGGAGYLVNCSFGVVSATGAPIVGGQPAVYVSQVTPSVAFGELLCDSTNAGPIVAVAGNDATHYPVFDSVRVANPAAGSSIDGGNGPVVIRGGWVGGAISAVAGAPSSIRNVAGYNPQAPAVVVVTASPWTYTNNDPYDEDLHLVGGSITSIVKGGVNLGANGPVHLEPGEAAVVTYVVAPAAAKVPY